MLTARAAHAVAAGEAGIFAVAGTGPDGTPVLDVERFDGTRWTREAALPEPGLNAPAAATVRGRLYLIGGFNAMSNVPTAAVRVYDIGARQWRAAAPLPEPRGGHAVAVLDGRIHVIGGGNAKSTLDLHSVYDPASDTWTARAPLPRAMGSSAAVVHGGRLYSIGGRSGASDFGDVYIYDPRRDAWTDGPAIEPRGTAGAVSVGDAIYLVGGESQARREALRSVLRLDVSAGRWSEADPMPTARTFARAVLFRGRVYTVGGAEAVGASHASRGSAIVESFAPARQRAGVPDAAPVQSANPGPR